MRENYYRRRWCIFYADDGGFQSTDEYNLPGLSLYFVGIIDILTPYNMVKKTEHIWKSITQDKVKYQVPGSEIAILINADLEWYLRYSSYSLWKTIPPIHEEGCHAIIIVIINFELATCYSYPHWFVIMNGPPFVYISAFLINQL